MGRKTVYNNIVGEKYGLVNEDNKELLEEWIEYLHSVNRATKTISQYENDFKIWCVWAFDNAEDKFFIEINKRDIMKFQGYCLRTLGHSPARVRRLRSTLSSISNYVENILDDTYPDFRNIINKIEAPTLAPVRKKLIMNEEEVNNILEKLVDKKMYQQACYFALSCYGGARKSELLRFKADWFKDEYLENGLYKTPEKIKSKGRGKNGKMIDKWTIKKYFDPYYELWMNQRKELEIDSEWLFVRQISGKYESAIVSTANSWANTISSVLGETWYPHANRHYFCTMLCKAGIPAEIIKDIISWANVSLISTYNDADASDSFSKYFSENGIVEQDDKNMKDL